MNYLFTLPELLSMRSNAWGCADCGQVWVETIIPGLWSPRLDTRNPACRHPKLARTFIPSA